MTKSECKPGDLIFYGSDKGDSLKIQHTGIIYSNLDGIIQVIHCSSKYGVEIAGQGEYGYDNYWEKRFLFIKRFSNNDLLSLESR